MSASGPRLLLQSLSIAPLHLLVDVHTAGGSRHVPITVDTHRWAHCIFQTIRSTHGGRQASCTESPPTASLLKPDNSHNHSECLFGLTCAAGQAHSRLSQSCPAAGRCVRFYWTSFGDRKPVALY